MVNGSDADEEDEAGGEQRQKDLPPAPPCEGGGDAALVSRETL